jgi:hypothetical protein
VPLDADPVTAWQPGLAALEELRGDPQWQTTGIEFVLSSHFVRYAVIPADPNGQTETEQAALSAIVFRQTYGKLCEDWPTTVSETRKSSSTLGAAIPPGLLQDLRAQTGRHSSICSIRPNLMEAFNRISDELQRGPAIFALVEPGRTTIARVADGAWQAIFSRLMPVDDSQAFPRVMEEEATLRPVPDGTELWIRDPAGIAVIPTEWTGRVRTVPGPWSAHPATAFAA